MSEKKEKKICVQRVKMRSKEMTKKTTDANLPGKEENERVSERKKHTEHIKEYT
jgi:hypothetical protein